MIIQGDNHPTIIVMDTDISNWPSVSVGLYDIGGRTLKRWDKSELVFEKVCETYNIACPWSAEETAALPTGKCAWLIKAKDPDYFNQFWGGIYDFVQSRADRGAVL